MPNNERIAVLAVYSVVLSFVLVSGIVGLVLLFLRRNIHPIKARPFTLLFVSQTCFFILSLSSCANQMADETYPCFLMFLFSTFIVPFQTTAYLIRVYLLLLRHQLQKALGNFQQDKRKSYDLANWVLKRKYLTRPAFLNGAYISLSLLQSLPSLIVVFIDVGNVEFPSRPPCATFLALPGLIGTIIIGVLCLICAMRLYKFQDSFFIKKELAYIGLIFITWAILTSMHQSAASNRLFPIRVLLSTLSSLAMFLTSTWYPIYKSYRTPAPPRTNTPIKSLKRVAPPKRAPSDNASLLELLETEEGYELFKKHLMKEFSLENLLFWKAIEDWRVIGDTEKRNSEAALIYKTFIRTHSPMWVNISNEVHVEIRRTLQNCATNWDGFIASVEQFPVVKCEFSKDVPTDVFDETQRVVFRLMEGDSYTRWVIGGGKATCSKKVDIEEPTGVYKV